MKTKHPMDCGNAPRITIVGDFVSHWAEGDTDGVAAWLTQDATWTLVGKAPDSGEDVADTACPRVASNYLEITSIITHGRLASCDGFLDTDSGRVDFSHVFRFASTSKAAKIKEARTYLIENRI